MIVNLAQLEAAGLEAKEAFASWDEVWEYAGKLVQKDSSGQITRAGLNVREIHQLQYICGFILEQGGQYFDQAAGEFHFNTPEGKNAVELLAQAFSKGVDSYDLPDAFESLANDRSAMGMIWIDYIPYAKSQFPDKRFGFMVRPPYPGSAKLIVAGEGGWGVNVSARSKNKDAAIEFVCFLDRDENMLAWGREQNGLPSVRALLKDPSSRPDNLDACWNQGALRTMDDRVHEGPFPIATVNLDFGRPAVDDIWKGKVSAADGLTRLEQSATAAYQTFREQVEQLAGELPRMSAAGPRKGEARCRRPACRLSPREVGAETPPILSARRAAGYNPGTWRERT